MFLLFNEDLRCEGLVLALKLLAFASFPHAFGIRLRPEAQKDAALLLVEKGVDELLIRLQELFTHLLQELEGRLRGRWCGRSDIHPNLRVGIGGRHLLRSHCRIWRRAA